MADNDSISARYAAHVTALMDALERGDEPAFTARLDELLDARKPAVFNDLRDLTSTLKIALDRFRLNARLAGFAEKDMPDARERLMHVLKLTEEAAHRTLDLVEQSAPPAERTAKAVAQLTPAWKKFRAREIDLPEFHEMLNGMDALLPSAHSDCETIRRNLSEVLLTQGYQDLTGQIIRGVVDLVREVETVLVELSRLVGFDAQPAPSPSRSTAHGYGPVVPGVTRGEVANGQQDVDALLSGLGM